MPAIPASSASPVSPVNPAGSARGASPRPPAPGWAGTLVDGTRAMVSDASGDITPGTAQGLYADGRRLLDLLELRVGLGPLATDGSETVGAEARYDLVVPGLDGGPAVLEVVRRRTLGIGVDARPDALLTDHLTVTSQAPETVATWLRVVVGGDGLDAAEVRAGVVAGRAGRADVRRATVSGTDVVVLDDERHEVRVSQEPEPLGLTSHDGQALLETELVLPPGEPVTVVVTVAVTAGPRTGFVAAPGAAGVDWQDVGIAADDPRLVMAVGHAIDDLRHLLVRDPLAPDDVVAVSGAPWRLVLQARDALWVARLTLPFGLDLALGTLRVLARRQVHLPAGGDPSSATAGTGAAEDASYPVGADGAPDPEPDVAEVTALWVCLLGEARQWGLADHRVRELLPTLQLAVAWIRGRVATGLLVDEPAAAATDGGGPGGTVPPGPLTRLEVQAVTVEALCVAAALLTGLQVEGSEQLEAEAAALAERVRDRFWTTGPRGSRLVAALDAVGAPVDGEASALALALGTGVLSARESRSVVDRVMEESRRDPFRLGVHGSGEVRPGETALVAWSLLRSGFTDEASTLARALVEVSETLGHQWPEAFRDGLDGSGPRVPAGAARPTAVAASASAVVLQSVLGLAVDVPAGRVRVLPPRTAPFGRVDVTGLRFQGHAFRVTVGDAGQVDVQGLPSDVVVETHPEA